MKARSQWGSTVLARDFDVPSLAVPHFNIESELLPTPSMGAWRRPHTNALRAVALSTAIFTSLGAPSNWQAWAGAGGSVSGGDWMIYADPADLKSAAHLTKRVLTVQGLKQRIDSFRSRMPNWDGDDGIAPNPDAVDDALSFMHGLSSSTLAPGAVFAPGDGEVMFQWHTPEAFVEVGFHGDGMLSWCAEVNGGKPRYGDEAYSRSAPTDHPELLSILTTL